MHNTECYDALHNNLIFEFNLEIKMAKSQFPSFEEACQPFMAYSKMAADTVEKAMKVQFDSYKALNKIGMDNFAESLKVTNVEQMTAYAEKQKNVAKKTNDLLTADAKALTDLGAKFFEGSKALFEDSVKATMSAAEEVAKTAATGK